MQILKVLLVLLLVAFPFGETIRFSFGNNIFLKPFDIIIGLILICTTVLYIKEKKYRFSLHWYFFSFPLIGLLSLGINSIWLKPVEEMIAFFYLVRWVAYMSIFWGVIQLEHQFRKKLQILLFVDGLVFVVIGFLQYFFYPNLNNLFYQGWDNHIYRLFSSFLDPNFAGSFLVLYLIYVAGYLFIKEYNYKHNLILICSSLISTLIAIFLTYSRSALLMLIISCVTFFELLGRIKYIIYLFLILGVFIILASPFFYIENINLFRTNSSLERVMDLEKGLTIFRDHPILGVGFDSYRYAQYQIGRASC